MPRKPKTLEELTTDLTTDRQNKRLTNPSAKEETQKMISDIIGEKMLMLADVQERGKVNLNSMEDVEAVTMVYLESCRKSGNPPNFEGLASALGYSRQNLYHIIKSRNDDISTFLDRFRTICADIIQTASSKRLLDNATSIFILKSMTGLGFTDKNDEIPEASNCDDDSTHDLAYLRQKYGNLISDY